MFDDVVLFPHYVISSPCPYFLLLFLTIAINFLFSQKSLCIRVAFNETSVMTIWMTEREGERVQQE